MSSTRRRLAVAVSSLALLPLVTAPPAGAHHANPQPGPVNAGNTFGWFPTTWYDNWETHDGFRPYKARHRLPRPWRGYSNGSGLAYVQFAQMTLDSSDSKRPGNFNKPSTGSVKVVRNGRGSRYGRWEIRLRAPVFNRLGAAYDVRAELVPRRPALRGNGQHNIGLARFTAGGRSVQVYARNDGLQWQHTKRKMNLGRAKWHTYAVEITRKRISWYIDAHAVAKTRTPRAFTRMRYTPAVTLAGIPGRPMARTKASYDWLRYFKIHKAKERKRGWKKRFARKQREVRRAPAARVVRYVPSR